MQHQPCSSREFCAKGVRPMRGKRLSIGLTVTLLIFTVSLFMTSTLAAAQEQVLHNFNNNGTDGTFPQAGLIVDGAGNLYGTTSEGGTYISCSGGCGTVFELTPNGSGGWTETVLHNFNSNGTDGANPYAGLIFDAAGNLYGTTTTGGSTGTGYGTVFELTPAAGGTWTEQVLYSFRGGTDGTWPYAGLIFDAAGNLYGTTPNGSTNNGGIAFELTPAAGGTW